MLFIHDLVSGTASSGTTLLLGAQQVWPTNVIAFGLAYWN